MPPTVYEHAARKNNYILRKTNIEIGKGRLHERHLNLMSDVPRIFSVRHPQ